MDLRNFLNVSKVFHKMEYVMLFAGSHLVFCCDERPTYATKHFFALWLRCHPALDTIMSSASFSFMIWLIRQGHWRRTFADPGLTQSAKYELELFSIAQARMTLGSHFTGFVWGTCLYESHCKRICHPLFCGGFWRCTKISLLIALNIVLTREEVCINPL